MPRYLLVYLMIIFAGVFGPGPPGPSTENYSDGDDDDDDDDDEDEDGYTAQDEAHYPPIGIQLMWQWGACHPKHIDFRGVQIILICYYLFLCCASMELNLP